jgi:hypothetical protein
MCAGVFRPEEKEMSAGLWDIEVPRTIEGKHVLTAIRDTARAKERWDPARYSEGQVRGLVRQVFLSNALPAVRQVVFSRTDSQTNIDTLVTRVARVLAESSSAEIAIVKAGELAIGRAQTDGPRTESACGALKRIAREVQPRLWLLPEEAARSASMSDYLSVIRREFEYSILLAESGTQSGQATEMAQAADGMVLVLSARYTRRAAARRIKQSLDDAGVRLLGTVLTDREFPIPEGIYRRL